MSINKKAFKTNKEKVFEGVAKRNPKSLRKTGEVEDKEGKKEEEGKKKKKTAAELKKAQQALAKIKKAKSDKNTKMVDRSGNRAYG
jgi:hypothetical protein